ncbi:MAG: hypothetical protein HYS34_07130 [Acidobacteria bacterium]|nr:hypothetical protein [Acidobacteriota bacterium]
MVKPVMDTLPLAASAILIAGLLVACGPRSAEVTVQQVDAMRARWVASPVRSYHIIVDVERPGDRRRNDITLLVDTVTRSSVAYWNEKARDWGPARELTAAKATPFTVPGLYDSIREELLEGHRSDCRVAFVGDPPVPERILLGPVMGSGAPMPGTEATVIVRAFEPLSPAPRQ